MHISWVVAVVFVLLALLLAVVAAKASQSKSGEISYQRAGPLFTPAERSIFGVLEQTIGKDHRVFGKVRVADVVHSRAHN